ncbi:MAG: MlaC/ttg2D family ABC transporter substrate-binding protein [Candidatus Binatia bacterium]
MKQKRNNKLWLTWIALLFFCAPGLLHAGPPTEEIQATVEKAMAVLRDPTLKAENRRNERRDQIRQALLPRFDFSEMAKRSLGAHWRRRTPEEQREFTETFTDLLERAYIQRIEGFDDEKFVYTRERREQKHAEVDGKILTKKGEEFSINYKLHLTNEGWKVYDVVIENISLVNNYRDQFNRVITKSSYEDLIRRLKEKSISSTDGRK